MKKPSHKLNDLFTDQEMPESEASKRLATHIADELRKHRILNAFFIVAIGCLVLLVAGALLYTTRKTSSAAHTAALMQNPYVPAYSLPMQEQWVLDYDKALQSLPDGKIQRPRKRDTQWVKFAAYNVIMGEQALRNGTLDLAKYHLEKALVTFPDLHGIHGSLGIIHLRQKEFGKAVEHLHLAHEEGGSVDLLNNLGVAYMGLKEFDRAEKYLQQAMGMLSDQRSCHKNLALLYQQTGRIEDAILNYEAYFKLCPEDLDALHIYIGFLTDLGRTNDAIAFLESKTTLEALPVYLLLARTAAQNNDAQKAVSALKNTTRFISPAETLTEMHHDTFEQIRGDQAFEALAHQLELASASLSTNLFSMTP